MVRINATFHGRRARISTSASNKNGALAIVTWKMLAFPHRASSGTPRINAQTVLQIATTATPITKAITKPLNARPKYVLDKLVMRRTYCRIE